MHAPRQSPPPAPRAGWRVAARWAAYGALAWFTWLLLRITLQYWPIDDDVAFLRVKQDVIDILPWKVAFFVHVFTSVLVLLAGFTQFAPALLRRRPRWHRWLGRAYVANVLLVTGPASLVMGFLANGGPLSRVAFVLLAVLWIWTTWRAYAAVRARDFHAHREWMIRSYALTLSAVTLRAWKYGIVLLFAPGPMTVYRLVAWLGWTVNLAVAEWWIWRTRRLRVALSAPPPEKRPATGQATRGDTLPRASASLPQSARRGESLR